MLIKKIKISNFKSFDNLDIELGNFNVLIGANASGKSNFIQIFKFLRDISNFGLDDAISMQGGVDYFRNVNIGSEQNFSIDILSKPNKAILWTKKNKFIVEEINELRYKFAIKFSKTGLGYRIFEDRLEWESELFDIKNYKIKRKIAPRKIIITNDEGTLSCDIPEDKKIPIEKDDMFYCQYIADKLTIKEEKTLKKALMLEYPLFMKNFMFATEFKTLFNDIAIYNFDPKLIKETAPITGRAELEEDGKNLSIVLKNIRNKHSEKKKFFNLIKDILPFVDDLKIKNLEDKSVLIKLREYYVKDKLLPALFISDGTVIITALIIALYFQKKPLIIIEEPERNLHPALHPFL